ncbi:MAG TPA: DUF1569 domain-containing protein [Chryseolinea sp.]|nr:DUF1569 domain-containing protein [Chryseolinea sp.]
MKKTIFDRPVLNELITRIAKLETSSKGRWGKLTAQQMVRHLTEACRIAFDEVVVPDCSNFLTRSVLKWLFLNNIKPPGREKGKIKTFAEVDVVNLNLKVDSLDVERTKYTTILQRMAHAETLSLRHPLFGKMDRADWGLLTYAHADYHLTQFDV